MTTNKLCISQSSGSTVTVAIPARSYSDSWSRDDSGLGDSNYLSDSDESGSSATFESIVQEDQQNNKDPVVILFSAAIYGSDNITIYVNGLCCYQYLYKGDVKYVEFDCVATMLMPKNRTFASRCRIQPSMVSVLSSL